MSRQRFSRVLACLVPALPLASMACGQGFNGETPGSGGEPDGGSIHFGDGSAARDSAPAHDAGAGDARPDGASDDGKAADREGVPEADAPETQAEAQAETEAGSETGAEAGAETDAAEPDGAVSGCPASKPTLCNGTTCVNTSDDPQNCNGCGIACTGNPTNSQPTCSAGACGFACDAGYEQCGNTCLVSVPDVAHGVFVAPGGPSSGCGTPDVPCGTISGALAAIEQADAGTKNIVYVAESATPYVQNFRLPAGVTIEGGWVDAAGQWSHPCALDASQVVLQAPLGIESVVLATSGGSSTLRTLTLVNRPSALAAEQSLFGAIVSGSGTQLSLENVQVAVGAAGSGFDGSPGAAGMGSVACTTPGDSHAGAPVGAGMAGAAGTYSSWGYQQGGMGGIGGIGNPGDNGGAGGAPVGTCTPTSCGPSHFACQIETGTPATGAPGTPGCGGNGGQGGSGGTGGGSSIAVLAWGPGVQVSITGGVLAPGNGGNGGSGGAGGAGAPGVSGAAGASRNCSQAHCSGTVCSLTTPTTAYGGAAGSAGGEGAQGGTGGGGAGGDSYCYYAGDGATVAGTFQCQQAAGGAGGAPNGPPGTGAAHN